MGSVPRINCLLAIVPYIRVILYILYIYNNINMINKIKVFQLCLINYLMH